MRSTRLIFPCVVLILLAVTLSASAQNPPLQFGDNFFVTGDYALGGVSLEGKASSGYATATISIGNDTNPGVKGTNSVPPGAQIVFAFLYWQSTEIIGGANAQNIFFRPVFNGGPQTGYAIKGTILANPNGTVYWGNNNGCASASVTPKQLVTYRAEVRAFLPQDASGNIIADGTYEVRIPSQSSGTPLTMGATLVLGYRVIHPNFPLNSIVIYDGTPDPTSASSTSTLNFQGFDDAAPFPVSKLTYIMANGQKNLTGQAASFEGTPLKSLYGANQPLFPGAYPGGGWDNVTYFFGPNNNPLPGDASSATTKFTNSSRGCVTPVAVIFSTTVNDPVGDGILGRWKNDGGYCDASINGGSCPAGGQPSTGWVSLPGVEPGKKDVFIQIDYMCSKPTGPDSCDTSASPPDLLSAASPGSGAINSSGGYTTYTISAGGCSAPFTVGTAITIAGFTNSTNNGQFTIASCTGNQLVVNNAKGVVETPAAGTATFTNYSFDPRQVIDPTTGADAYDEVMRAYDIKGIVIHPEFHAMQETPGCTDTTVNGIPSYCPFLYQPGLIGWKGGFDVLKGHPLNLNPDGSTWTESQCEQAPLTGPNACIRRFQHGRKDSYHEVIFGHAWAGSEWSFQQGTLTSVTVSGSGKTVTFTTSIPHGLVQASGMNDQNPLARVTVSDAVTDTMLSGTYLVQSVPSHTTFTILLPNATNLPSFTPNTDPGLSVASGRVHTRSGFSDVGGADSVVTLGLWDPALAKQVMGTTFMHEFGHSNGLTHGGFYYDKLTANNNNYIPTVEANCKPNFQSVMSYPFQLAHLDTGASLAVDYSEEQWDALTENSLPAGLTINNLPVASPKYPITEWYTPTKPAGGTQAKTYCDGTPVGPTMYQVSGPVYPIGGTGAQLLLSPPWSSTSDVNFDDSPTNNIPDTTMRGHSDWANVVTNGLIISPGIDLRQVGATGADAFGSGASIGPGGGPLGPGGASLGPGGASLGPGGGPIGPGGASLGPGGGPIGPGGASLGPGGGPIGPGGGVGEVDTITATSITFAPSHETATEGTSPRTITLNWTDAFGLIGAYNVYRSGDGGNTFAKIAPVPGNPPATMYTDTVTCNPTGYQYFVTAVQSSSSPNPGQESGPSNLASVGQNGQPITGCYTVTFSSPGSGVQGSPVSITWTLQDASNQSGTNVTLQTANTLIAIGPLPGNCTTSGRTTLLADGTPTNVIDTFGYSGGMFTFMWNSTDGFCAGSYNFELDLDHVPAGAANPPAQVQLDPISLALGIDVNDNDTTPFIVPISLPTGTVGNFYSTTLVEDGGTLPVKWAFVGAFPPSGPPPATGISQLSQYSATLSGTTCTAGRYVFTATVTDSAVKPNMAMQNFFLTINQASTTTSVISSPASPSTYGQAVTFTATVTPQYGCMPTGIVTFSDVYNGGPSTMIGAVNMSSATALANGSFSVSYTTSIANNTQLMAGAHSITAAYSGDNNFTASNNSANPLLQTVNPALLTITATAADKVYDGTPTASVTLHDNRFTDNYDVFTDNDASALFTTQNVGNGITVNVSGISISGQGAGNYTLNGITTASTTANITVRPLYIDAITATKTYDGTTSPYNTATNMLVYPIPEPPTSVKGLVSGDILSGLTEAFISPAAGPENLVVQTYTLGDPGNYVVTLNNVLGTINQYPLTVTATGVNKFYDTTTSATVTLSDNRLPVLTDSFSDSYTSASFVSSSSGTGIEVDVTGISISGSGAGNYALVSTTAQTTASIYPVPPVLASGASISTLSGGEALATDSSGNVYVKSLQDPGGTPIQVVQVTPSKTFNNVGSFAFVNSDGSGIAANPRQGGGVILADESTSSIEVEGNPSSNGTLNGPLFTVPWTMDPKGNGTGQQQYAPGIGLPNFVLYFWDNTEATLYGHSDLNGSIVSAGDSILALDTGTPVGMHVNTVGNHVAYDSNTSTLLLTNGPDGSAYANSVLEVNPATAAVTTLFSALPGTPTSVALKPDTNQVFVGIGNSIYGGPRSGGSLTLVTSGFVNLTDIAIGNATSGVGFSLFAVDKATNTVYEISPLGISTPNPALSAVEGTPFGPVNLTASGGTGPYSWVPSNVDGLSLSSAGALSGTPTSGGSFVLPAQVSDSASPTASTATNQLSITVAPQPVSGLAVSGTPAASSTPLTWPISNSGDVTGYNVYRSTTSGVYTTPPIGSVPQGPGPINFTDTSALTTGTTYYYIVRAVGPGNIESANSNEVSVVGP